MTCALGAQVQAHPQEHLAKILIVRLLKTHLFSSFQKSGGLGGRGGNFVNVLAATCITAPVLHP